MPINVSGASGFLEADVGVRTPVEGICSPDPRVVFGYKPDSPGRLLLVLVGAAHPGPLTTEVSPLGAVFIAPAPLDDQERPSGTTPRSRPP